ncbi:putative NAD(P)-binding protein [Terracoccus luteus]|uniref:Putative NAD(P)-binding protein n=1 Tax=Terracoccus luteus TaxID=53356 RepID=A0A495Y339_9MICO|nr:SDR family oxidoreductase [Terracoccus luteus]RKT79814.1 putative NAD(P)-binding protein [Terracoccus luteus]
MSRVVVIGGHGKVALLAAPLLSEAGHEVISVIRNPEHEADVRDARAEPVVADVESASTGQMVDLVRGADVVVWSAGAGGGSPERTYAVDRDAAIRSMEAARQAGVQRYVMVSYFGAGPDHGVPEDNSFFAYAEAKTAADEHLASTELRWTILRPSGLTLDEPTGLVEFGDDVEAGHVSRANVARVIAAVVDAPDSTSGRELAFNDGDRPISELVGG